MKARQERRTATLRLARAAIGNAEVAKENALTEAEIEGVLHREAKKRREATDEFSRAIRPDRVRLEREELAILLEYRPQQLSPEELEKLARDAIADVDTIDAQQMGSVMGKLMPLVKGKADGRWVNRIVQELLGTKE
jgi:hypothetical protein